MRGLAVILVPVLLAACGADGPPLPPTFGASADRGPLAVTAQAGPGGHVSVSGTVSIGVSGGSGR